MPLCRLETLPNMKRLTSAIGTHAPWVIPVLAASVCICKQFKSWKRDTVVDAKAKAHARCKGLPKLNRGLQQDEAVANESHLAYDADGSNFSDAEELHVQLPDTLMEWYNEDEVEAMQQAMTSQSQTLMMMQR
jgi:hypothetical protein